MAETNSTAELAPLSNHATIIGDWPKVTICIVNWNGASFLDSCLNALMAQTVTPHEIILVDNASSDDSLSIVRRFTSVRLLAQSENLGFARANNLAIEKSSGQSEWIVLLNPDAFVSPDWLESMLSAAAAHRDFDFFACKLVDADDPTLSDGSGDAYHVSGLVWRVGHRNPLSTQREDVREIFSPCAAAAMYRFSAIRDVGGFDEDYFCYIEDVDLGFRLRLAGYRCLYIPQAVAHHVGSGTTGGLHSDFAVYHGHRNLVWTYVKNMPGLLFWFFLPLHLAMNLVTIISFTFRGQGGVIMRAKLDSLRAIPRIWRMRQEIQCKRSESIYAILRQMEIFLG